jgi:hypothetical protein
LLNAGATPGYQLLVQIEGHGVDPDKRGAIGGWEATAQQRFERLLRETGVYAGVLISDDELRLVYAPSGETSGWLAFPLDPAWTIERKRELLDGAFQMYRRRGTPDDWNAQIERAKCLSDDEREHLLGTIAAEVGDETPARRRFVNWDEVAEMSRHGIGFGSHSGSHANLTRLQGAALERELREPLETLRRPGVNHVPVLAYPNGDYSDAVVDAARAAGYQAAVTVRRGLESFVAADRFRLRRIGVHEDVSRSVPTLALHIGRQSRAAGRW